MKLAILALANKKGKKNKEEEYSPLRDALREAFESVKADDFDGFCDAMEGAMEIKSSSEEDGE